MIDNKINYETKPLFGIMFFLLVIACNKNEIGNNASSLASTMETKSATDFDFKNVIMDTLSWRNLSGDEKMKMCQIPELTLKNLSTAALAKICFDFPLFFEFVLTNNEEKAISGMIESFNGLKELSSRSDGEKELMKIYSGIAALKEKKISNLKDPGVPLRFRYLELLLTNDKFLVQLDKEGKNLLADLLDKKQKEKKLNPKVYGGYSTDGNYRFIEKVLNITKSDPALPMRLNTSDITYVTTPFGKTVTGYIRDEFTAAEKYNATHQVIDNYNVVLLDSASRRYNCHSYAWNINGSCWINATINTHNDNLSKYWTNDLYTTTHGNSYGSSKIFYYNGDHSALAYYGTTYYVSKWGSGPLVSHSPTEVPSSYHASYRTHYYAPSIVGPDFVSMGNTYEYLAEPYMNYATYVWRIEDDDKNNYNIVSQSGNSAMISFSRGGTFQLYCDIYNTFNVLVYTLFFEPLNGDY